MSINIADKMSGITTADQKVTLALNLANQGKIAEGERLCLEVVVSNPNHVDALHFLGASRARAGDWLDAEKWLRRAIAAPGQSVEPRFTLIRQLICTGRTEEAVAELQEIQRRVIDPHALNIGKQRSWHAPLTIEEATLSGANLAFSLGGEDLVLRKLFKRKLLAGALGFYVDIGCNKPIEASNTYLFYCYGWQGICIDPLTELADQYKIYRPRDLFMATAVSDSGQSALLARNRIDGGRGRIVSRGSTLDDSFEAPTSVPIRRLDAILTEHVPKSVAVDFFSIDVEGSELAVLQSNDWRRFRPAAIVLEAVNFVSVLPRAEESVAFLQSVGYGVYGSIPPNVFLVDDESTTSLGL